MDRTGDSPDSTGPGWESGWEGHSSAQAEYLARLPFLEKLRWLEEAHELAILLLGEEGFERARQLGVGESSG